MDGNAALANKITAFQWTSLTADSVLCSFMSTLIFCVFSFYFIYSGFELSHCDDPGVPQFGFKISDQGHFAGSSITFGCEQGYTLHGSGILKCMTGERRAWDNNLPSCIGNPFCFSLTLSSSFSHFSNTSDQNLHVIVSHGPLLCHCLCLILLFRTDMLSTVLS